MMAPEGGVVIAETRDADTARRVAKRARGERIYLPSGRSGGEGVRRRRVIEVGSSPGQKLIRRQPGREGEEEEGLREPDERPSMEDGGTRRIKGEGGKERPPVSSAGAMRGMDMEAKRPVIVRTGEEEAKL
jgi:hypothetical protein